MNPAAILAILVALSRPVDPPSPPAARVVTSAEFDRHVGKGRTFVCGPKLAGDVAQRCEWR